MAHVPPDARFRSLVTAALALAACSPKTPPKPAGALPPPEPPGLAEPAECEQAYAPALGPDVSPAEPVDALGIASANRTQDMGLDVRTAFGTLCVEGPDCVAPRLEGGLRTDCGQIGCVESSVVWSRDGAPGAATTTDALLAFLGPIDTAGDARVLAWAAGYEPTACPIAQVSGVWRVTVTRMVADCPIQIDAYDLDITPTGEVTVAAHRPGPATGACIGRLPAGLASLPTPEQGDRTVGAWLARAAHLEAASVYAFRQLHAELVHHGAPGWLCEAALACLDDEVRHARLVGNLAVARGATVAPPVVTPPPLRSLVDVALDNAAEGCGREAWGAVIGRWQGQHAADSAVRTVMRSVATDELRHAEFSFALDGWLRTQLTAAQCARVDRAARRARRQLAREAKRPHPPGVREALGLPDAARSVALWTVLAEA